MTLPMRGVRLVRHADRDWDDPASRVHRPGSSAAVWSFVEHMGRTSTAASSSRATHGDGRRIPRRCPGAGPGARRHGGPLPGRQLRVGLPLGGRGRAGRPAAGAAEPRVAHPRAEPVRSRRIHPTGRPCRGRADARREPRDTGRGRGASTSWSTPTIRAAPPSPTSASRTARDPSWRPDVVPRQRDGRPMAARPQDGVRIRPLGAETARAMRQFDPTLELVACGSSGPGMPTYVEWERGVLAESLRARRRHLAPQLLPAGTRRPDDLPGLGRRP